LDIFLHHSPRYCAIQMHKKLRGGPWWGSWEGAASPSSLTSGILGDVLLWVLAQPGRQTVVMHFELKRAVLVTASLKINILLKVTQPITNL